MPHDPYVFAAVAALFLFAIYRRVRRLIGRQPLAPSSLKIRIGVFSLLALLLALRGLRAPLVAEAGVAGFAGGVALAWLGIRLTRFETTSKGNFYTPNAYIGAILSALVLGRLVYRFVVLYPAMQGAAAAGANPLAMYQRSPLTAALFGLLLGYYIAYFAGLLMRSANLPAHRADADSPPSGP